MSDKAELFMSLYDLVWYQFPYTVVLWFIRYKECSDNDLFSHSLYLMKHSFAPVHGDVDFIHVRVLMRLAYLYFSVAMAMQCSLQDLPTT